MMCDLMGAIPGGLFHWDRQPYQRKCLLRKQLPIAITDGDLSYLNFFLNQNAYILPIFMVTDVQQGVAQCSTMIQDGSLIRSSLVCLGGLLDKLRRVNAVSGAVYCGIERN